MVRYESVLDSVGGTPLIRLTRSVARPRIYVKPEWQNPGGSVKDRAAVAMLRRAEADGSLRPGGTVVEVTSGNTGIGLAMAAAHLGYRAVIFTGSSIPEEKKAQLRAYGADLRLVDSFVPKDHPDSLRSHAARYVEATPGAWFAGQYDNAANPAVHYATTGPEIWADSDGRVTHVVATVGTGGTVSGTARYLKEVSDGRVRVIGADPEASAFSGGDGSYTYVEGAGRFVHPETSVDTWPTALDPTLIDEYVTVTDREAIDAVRHLARTEGILAGGSSGVALAAALRLAEGLGEEDTVVVVLPDSGRTYLSTYFNDTWLLANGFAGTTGEPTVGSLAVPVTSAARDEEAAEVVRRLEAQGHDEDDVVLVTHPRGARGPAPHGSDVLGWTTLAGLRAAATTEEAARAPGPRLGAGLAVDDPAVRSWDGARFPVALVIGDGRVTATLTHDALTTAQP